MNTLVAVAIAPCGVGDELSAEVAEVVKVIRDSGLPNKTYSMFTEIEGEWDKVMETVKKATFVLAEKGIRTEVVMKMDIRPGFTGTNGRPVEKIVEDAVKAGFTIVQIRSKEESALELIEDLRKSAEAINRLGKSQSVSLVVDDRLDVVLAAREQGIKVDGIHVGQKDIPVSVCRKFLGKDSIIGLSAPTLDLINYVKNFDCSEIDYFGAGPVHETATKPDCGMDANGKVITKTFDELSELAVASPIPVVVGGGVKLNDIAPLRQTGVGGFFVVSAVAGAEYPYAEAKKLVDAWKA